MSSLREKYVHATRAQGMHDIPQAKIRWQSPSNIALVKYWGKHGDQLPMNPSISLTLSRCFSDTFIQFTKKSGPSATIDLSFTLDQSPAPHFETRIKKYLESVVDLCPFLTQYQLEIQSSNSFPHSAGIASSASGLSALALCLTTMEDTLYSNLDNDEEFRRKASYLARLGSGSASRSIYNQSAWWGKTDLLAGSSDLFAVGCADLLHPVFSGFQNTILIVSAEKKPVSSSRGHHLMEFHPYRDDRYRQAQQHLSDIKSALQKGDIEHFGKILESEALSLHALMISSSPGYFLITQNTIEIIRTLRAFREEEGIPCFFTLDAGPNIHLLYPQSDSKRVKDFIINELEPMTERVIYDEIGDGPVQFS